MKKGIALLLLIALAALQYVRTSSADQNPFLVTDYSRLHPVKVERVILGKAEEQLVQLVAEAKEKGLKLSIAGQRHSQGGHTYYKDAIVVDMTSYNRIISVDPSSKRMIVQAGATWEDVQEAVNPYGLSVKTMQSLNSFTIGGSISINAHGRDIRNGSLIKSVESFRLLTADGSIRNVSRSENADLFSLALGGYGLFGIILDVTLSLTEDELYRESTILMELDEYSHYFQNEVLPNAAIRLHIARISVAKDSYFKEAFAKNYTIDDSLKLTDYNELRSNENWVAPGKLLFNINRSTEWGRNLQWNLQKYFFVEQSEKIVSRNNAMRAASEFMEYSGPGANDLLQEYFIPLPQFDEFVQQLGAIVKEEDLNLLNITIRYVNKDEEAVLSYAKQDMLALVCLFHAPLSKEGQLQMKQGVERIVDELITYGGSYYLPYIAYPTLEQFKNVYPRHEQFFAKKKQYDPDELFMNYFYEQYGA
ncbi:FAD-binding oxidoreductase [Paenibacillus sp. FSL H8-0548]|uniref:FAD-binding oxidoreductase n=1 Tax=Paenibacillus sp. FSL H8-0548 TaxID=1920422 RepID=UPI00096EDBC1|nr:FAD-binding oxidoreductase [Paenibacillus sp. FSL H8-0548]OMF30872.1 FAD-binding oxidoreductase [Paenibacillus sp. FSL H8-0548]